MIEGESNRMSEKEALNILLIGAYRDTIRNLSVDALVLKGVDVRKKIENLLRYQQEVDCAEDDDEIVDLIELHRSQLTMIQVAIHDKSQ